MLFCTRTILKNRMNSSLSSNHPGAINPIFQIVQFSKELNKSSPPTEASADLFLIFCIFILLLCPQSFGLRIGTVSCYTVSLKYRRGRMIQKMFTLFFLSPRHVWHVCTKKVFLVLLRIGMTPLIIIPRLFNTTVIYKKDAVLV